MALTTQEEEGLRKLLAMYQARLELNIAQEAARPSTIAMQQAIQTAETNLRDHFK